MNWFSKNHLFSRNGLLLIAGVVMHALALVFGWSCLSWICVAPLLVVIQDYSGKKAFYIGLFYGFIFGWFALFWLPFTVLSLIQGTVIKAMITCLLGIGIFTGYYGMLIWLVSSVTKARMNMYKNALLIAAIWTVSDSLLSLISLGMPWYSLSIGNTLLDSLYAIQPAEFGGISFMGFCVVFINYLFAHYFFTKQWKRLVIPIGAIALYMIIGYFILYSFRQRWLASGQPVTVALLRGNIPADVRWNKENGSVLINGLLKLNQEALRTSPDFVLWPESVVPWSYRPDDDFVKTILKTTTLSSPTYHIVGMNTSLTQNELYNSAYCFLPDGTVAGRYDKHYLVTMAEEPMHFFSWSLPRNEEEAYFRPGKGPAVITTPKGKIGVLICNEVFVPMAARAAVKEGAEFLVSLASDALVASAVSVVNQQFFRSRLRAVEVRKDIAVSCNMGISGMISATGEILYADRSDVGSTNNVSLTPNRLEPKSRYFSMIAIYFSVLIILIFLFLHLKKNNIMRRRSF